MNRTMKIALVALVVSLPLLMAPTGGFPSRPKFSAVGIGTQPATGGQLLTMSNTASPYLLLSDSDAAANTKNVYLQDINGGLILGFCDDAVSACAGILNVARNAGANTASLINFTATDVQANGASILPTSGTFAATLTTGCTTTPSLNFRWARVGNVVTIASTGTTTCTSNSVTTALTAALPAAIRPTTNQCVAYIGATDNGAGTNAAVQVQADGDINIAEGLGTNCSALGWTSSGTKTLNEWNGSYVLN